MSKVPFTEEQIKILRDNPYTYHVTDHSLFLSKEFKALFYEEYVKGKPPRQILEEHGYPFSILGKTRIWGITALISKEAARPEGFPEGNSTMGNNKYEKHDSNPTIQSLQLEVEYLRQEVEYLKKISSIRNTRK